MATVKLYVLIKDASELFHLWMCKQTRGEIWSNIQKDWWKIIIQMDSSKNSKNTQIYGQQNSKCVGDLPKDNNFAVFWKHFTPECFERDIYLQFKAGNKNEIHKKR